MSSFSSSCSPPSTRTSALSFIPQNETVTGTITFTATASYWGRGQQNYRFCEPESREPVVNEALYTVI